MLPACPEIQRIFWESKWNYILGLYLSWRHHFINDSKLIGKAPEYCEVFHRNEFAVKYFTFFSRFLIDFF